MMTDTFKGDFVCSEFVISGWGDFRTICEAGTRAASKSQKPWRYNDMGLYSGFPGTDYSPGSKVLNNPFFYKGFPVLYFAGEML